MIRKYVAALIGALAGVVIVGSVVVLGQIRNTQVDHSPAVEHSASTTDVRKAFAAVLACVHNLDVVTYATVYACEMAMLDKENP